MKALMQCILIFYITNLFASTLQAAIEDFEVKNAKGATEFRVLDENRIKVPNKNRDNHPNLKMSLHGVRINKVHLTNGTEWTMELSDHSNATFKVEEKGNSMTEYYFQWFGGGQNVKREVCFHYGYNDAIWYSPYINKENASLHMNTEVTTDRFDFTLINDIFSKVKKDISVTMEYFFLNSEGFALLLDPLSPLFMRRSGNEDDPLLCFSVNNSLPYLASNSDPSYLDIKLHLFAGKNIRTVTDFVVHGSNYLPKPTEIPNENKFKYPSWMAWWESENDLIVFTEKIIKSGFPQHGEILFFEWEEERGCFCFNSSQTNGQITSNLSSIGFQPIVRFSPNFFYKPKNSAHLEKYFLKVQNLSHISFWFHVLDYSNIEAREWLALLLRKLHYENDIDSFLIEFLDFFNFSSIEFADPLVQKYPNLFFTKYIETIANLSKTSTSRIACRTQHLPTFVQIYSSYSRSPETTLKSLIPHVLSLSVTGYSFISPYPIFADNATEEELYIRLVQATALMPSMAIYQPPWLINQKATEISKKFVNLHLEYAPILIDLAKKRVQNGSPIIRPMWYVAPDDAQTYKIGDQFMLGDDILVAPVLSDGQRERTVYFPVGDWIDQHGKDYKGPSEFKVAAPLEELPYFKRRV